MRILGRKRTSGVVALLVVAVTAAFAVTAGPASAAPASAQSWWTRLFPIGVWSITLSRGDVSETAQWAFTRTGGACVVGQPDTAGSWHPTGLLHFSYELTGPLRDAGGNVVATVDLKHSAVQQGSTFSGSGTDYVRDLNGNLLAAVDVQIAASRLSVDAVCPSS